ncbi:MAG: SDR family NAD(P)-dependent oxidoreductase [Bryobacterales bacterium]|nr:SDR family NAD(P)-dependent oxidoreductase [Bryobacterales bacterium]
MLRPTIAAATLRAGHPAILDFEHVRDRAAVQRAVSRFAAETNGLFGVKLSGDSPERLMALVADLPNQVDTVLLTSAYPKELEDAIRLLRGRHITTLLEVRCLEHAKIGAGFRVDGLVAKGHEAGGRVADETTFILLQRLHSEVSLPIWAHGGIGLHTAGACAAAGAAGLILDAQLALLRESPLPESIKARIAAMDGSETICLGENAGENYRVYHRPGIAVVKDLQSLDVRLGSGGYTAREKQAQWREAVAQKAGWHSEQSLLMLGQDAAFAAPLAERFRTVGGVLHAFRCAIQEHCESARKLRPLAEGSPLAASTGTRYPILQGPMTRVSDVPEFARRVAEAGALPFLALALMRGPEVRTLLAGAQNQLGSLPWGVGILGFVPAELRQEQMDVILELRPRFALIAGGRPDQARSLEQKGIPTYLHVPSPGLLRMFVQQGARKFVFEGRECGGHVGPRTSFVLWNQMVDVLLNAPEVTANPQDFQVVFAAGIHDALSAAMVSVIAAPLAERGVRVGVLIGTAYLFTEEAVSSGAILETFQEQARECCQTVLLETAPGHSTRCVDTAYARVFSQEKQRLLAEGRGAEEIRLALEDMNLGRLRMASKGVTRNSEFGRNAGATKLVEVDKTEQISQGMYMIGQVAALRHSVCTIASLHHDVSAESSKRLAQLTIPSWQDASEAPKESPSDVAIVGMACLLPKAPGLQTYWQNIIDKIDAVGEIPSDRWDWAQYFDSDPKAKDKIYSKWGGFLDDIPFDPMQYGMPPASLRSIEPSQLLTLEAVRAALADAGYLDRPFARDRTSVILGAGGGAADLGLGYGARSFIPVLETLPEFHGRSKDILDRLDGRLPEWTEDSFAGILTNVSAGRVANRFDLGGSNYTVDAACASSLAAVSLALKELEGRTSDMVIVGGVDTMQNPFTYLCFSKTHALSPRGRCRTFDETADGIAISEGIVMLVLKRLADAERAGDRIYAVIKGAGSSSDGKDKGLTAPRPAGQAVALKRAYAKAGFSPATVGLVEAHGTGTAAGDSAEVQALTKVFTEAGASRQSCAIGSVKSMIGHTKCAAGAAGLVKAALALHHRVLPPTLGVEKPNSRARFPETPFFVNSEPRPWLESPAGHPRRAGVSAFGFGGTNFHVVLEEYGGDPSSTCHSTSLRWPEEVLLWKADSRKNLIAALERWSAALTVNVKPELHDLAYTSWKQAQEARTGDDGAQLCVAIVASSVDDLKQKLDQTRSKLSDPETVRINDPRGIYFSQQPLAVDGKLAFLFPGQGSQYPRMLQDLMLYFPEMRGTVERATRVLEGKLAQPLTGYLFPPPSFSSDEEQSRQKALTQTNVAQPALGAVSLALSGLLRELGIEPAMAAGHSYGEYTALAAAGVFSEETLITLSEARGRFIVEGAGAEPGAMAAVDADASVVALALQQFEGVCVANANSPRQTVISGVRAALEQVVNHFTAQGITARTIPVACAFHSPVVAPAQRRLAEFLEQAEVAEPQFTVFSNTTASPYPTEPQSIRERLVEHLVRPVEFVREIEAMYDAGARVFVEVGPRGILTSLADQILGDRSHVCVASNQNARPALVSLLHLIAQLASQGLNVKLDRLYQGRSCRRMDLDLLERECAPKVLPASVWTVNGSRARPVKEVANPRATRAATAAPVMAQAPAAAIAAPKATAAAAAANVPLMPVATRPVETPLAPRPEPIDERTPMSYTTSASQPVRAHDGVPQVMEHFQQMMGRFLETQKTIMLAYLAGEPAGAAPDLALPAGDIRPVPPDPVPVPLPQVTPEAAGTRVVSAPAVAASSVPAPQIAEQPVARPAPRGREDLTRQLLAIVSDRTGYPPEMLGLELDLEADLGIDSIKRVEILGAFQQTFATGAAADEGLMEKLSGVRTLNGILDVVALTAADAPVAKTDPPIAKETSTTPPERPAQEELTRQLLSIVSERTGYPPEMLDLDLDLEADLGIDSIKRVEILGTVQQALLDGGSALPEGLMEKLSGIRTLRGIVQQLCSQEVPAAANQTAPAASQPAPPAAVPSAEADKDDGIRRYTLTAVETPACASGVPIAKDRVVLITDGSHPVSREIARELITQGCNVAIVEHGESLKAVTDNRYSADLGSLESVAQAVALINQRQGSIGAVIHLLPLQGTPRLLENDLQDWKEQLRLGAKSLFYVAKATGKQLREAGPQRGASLIAATAMGGAFLTGLPQGAAGGFPDHGAVAGLIKTLAIEWPEVRVKVADFHLDDKADTIASNLLAEMTSEAKDVEVGYAGGRRFRLKLEGSPVQTAVPSDFSLDSSSVVLITGGARGITARAALRLAELYQPTLVLAGRSPLPPEQEPADTAGITHPRELKTVLMNAMRARGETVTPALVERAYTRLTAEREIRANLAAMRNLGAQVHYFPVDVCDERAFSALIEGIYISFGHIDGVIHGAGVIEDKLVLDKAPQSFDRVFHTKIDGAVVLSRKLRPDALKFLVFFSSVSGRFGNRGQADYAAANEVLNKLAVCLDSAWPARVVAINWGPWDTEGMVSDEVRKQFAERGVSLISPTVGLRRFEDELKYGRRGEAEVVIGGAAGLSEPEPAASTGSLPLLARGVSTHVNGSLRLVREIDPAHDLFLRDHLLDGRPVLPLAVATELIAETVAQHWPDRQVTALRDLRALHGIVVDSGSKAVHVTAKALNPEATSVAVEISSAGSPSRLHYSAVVDLARRLPAPEPLPPANFYDRRPFAMPIPELYRNWLFHGPLFQGIRDVSAVGPSGIVATLAASSPQGWFAEPPPGPWLIDPLMFDSALQLLVLWAREHWDMTPLPSGFRTLRRFDAPAASRIACELTILPNTGGHTIHSNMVFTDAATGQVLCLIDDMQGTCSKALNRLAGSEVLVSAANQA